MEEAWELAVVSDEENLLKEDVSWDWSAKHTRLRYQTALTATLFAMLSILGVDEKGIDFVFVSFDFDRKPEDGVIILGVGLFFIFSMASFVAQTFNERRRSAKYKKSFLALIKSVQSSIENLDSTLGSIEARTLESFRSSIKTLENRFVQRRSSDSEVELKRMDLEKAKDDIQIKNLVRKRVHAKLQSIFADIDAIVRGDFPMTPELAKQWQLVWYGTIENILTESDKRYLLDKELNVPNDHFDGFIGQPFDVSVEDTVLHLENLLNDEERWDASGKDFVAEFESAANKLKGDLNVFEEAFTKISSEWQSGGRMSGKLAHLRQAIETDNKIGEDLLKMGRMGFGVWIPAGYSLVAFLLGVLALIKPASFNLLTVA